MIDFRPLTIEDKEIFTSFFSKSTFRNCDFSFSNIYCWRHSYNTTYTIKDKHLLIRFYAGEDCPGYLYPLGDTDLKNAIEELVSDAKERKHPFVLYAITEKMFDSIEKALPGKFRYEKDRAWAEYIYDTERLINLKGKKLQSKRNHINKFKSEYPSFEYKSLSDQYIPLCLDLYHKWGYENKEIREEQSLMEEKFATMSAFDNFDKLDLKGGVILNEGKLFAYSFGQKLTEDTFDVQAEKSLYEIDGGFTIINQQFAEHECKGFKYANREEDLGIESLRRAKLSYQPVIILEKGTVTLK